MATTASPSPAQQPLANTNRWETRQLVTMALLCAIGVLLSFIELPLIPGVTFLKYDPSAMPAMVCGFIYGPGAGLAVGIIGAIIHGIIMADYAGALMNIIVVVGYVLPAAFIYRKAHTFKGAIAGLAVGVVVSVIAAILANLVVTSAYYGMPVEAVVAMIIPALLPFNLAKAVINSIITLAVYKSISNLVTPKKEQVRGR